MTSISTYWQQLVTVGLLGTDRRDLPTAPGGPIADTVDDQLLFGAPARLLAAVAATSAAMRGGVQPLAPAPPLTPPRRDTRRLVPPPAAAAYRTVVTDWPLLERDWLDAVRAGEWRLPPDVLVTLLIRHRPGSPLHLATEAVAGPLAGWLIEHVDHAGGDGPVFDGANRAAPADQPDPLVVSGRLQALLDGSPDLVADVIAGGFLADEFATPDRAVLVNLVARIHRAALLPLAGALRALPASVGALALALDLAGEAELRHRYWHDLRRPDPGTE